jgi:hypothetical protein
VHGGNIDERKMLPVFELEMHCGIYGINVLSSLWNLLSFIANTCMTLHDPAYGREKAQCMSAFSMSAIVWEPMYEFIHAHV